MQITARPLRENILGIDVSVVDLPRAVALVQKWIHERARAYVCVRDAHGIAASLTDPELRGIHNDAALVTPDGMPLVWICRFRGHRQGIGRVYGPDLMLSVCEASIGRGYRHFLFGATPPVLDRLGAALKAKFPGLAIAGQLAPPFRDDVGLEREGIIDQINAARPDIIWVGLGTPKQERWMAANRARLDAAVVIGVGAAFDFHSGVKAQAPLWMQKSGLEWLFRVASEPRRLWRRYLRTVPLFAVLCAAEALGFRNFGARGPIGPTSRKVGRAS